MADLDLEALRADLQGSLEPTESMDDVLAAADHLAERRAEALGREPEQADLKFAASILCWYPFKTRPPEGVEQDLKEIRSSLIRDAAQGEVKLLDQVVPDQTITADPQQLEHWQQLGVSEFLTSGHGAEG